MMTLCWVSGVDRRFVRTLRRQYSFEANPRVAETSSKVAETSSKAGQGREKGLKWEPDCDEDAPVACPNDYSIISAI